MIVFARRHGRTLLFCVASCLILLSGDRRLAAAGEEPPSESSPELVDRAAFLDPPIAVRPSIRWWWPGGHVEDKELEREIGVMNDAGFGAAEIQSFAVGLPSDVDPAVFTYGTPAWFDHLAAATDKAKELGFKLDLTLGSSWPSGGADLQDAESLQQLIVSETQITGPAGVNIPFPGPTEPSLYGIAREILQLPTAFDISKVTPVAIFAVKHKGDQTQDQAKPSVLADLPQLADTVYLDSHGVVDLSRFITPSKRINWIASPGIWSIFTFYRGPTGSQPFYGASKGGGLVVDHLSKSAIQRELETVAQAAANRLGDSFGTTLRSIFVDSLELRSELLWTEDLLPQFELRRGYKLEPFLPVLFRPYYHDAYLSKLYPDAPSRYEMRDVGPRVRQDFDETVSELMTERFFGTVANWGTEHGVQTRIQAHGGPVDLLNAYGKATIPETEGIYAGGQSAFLKVATSAAHASGKNLVSAEAFAARGSDATPQGILREANRNFAAGVNQIVFHGYPYVYKAGFKSTGWAPFNSPFLPARNLIGIFGSQFNENGQLWPFVPALTKQIARSQLVMQMGRPVARIALFTDKLGYPDDSGFVPEVNRQIERSGQNYDYVNRDILNSATVEGSELRIGSNAYSALILDKVTQIDVRTARRIETLANAGVPVILVGDAPFQSVGYLNSGQNDTEVADIFKRLIGRIRDVLVEQQQKMRSGSVEFIPSADALGKALVEDFQIQPDLILSDDRDDIHFAHRNTPSADYYFVTSSRDLPFDTLISFANIPGRVPFLFDVATGKTSIAPVYSVQGNRTVVPLHMNPGAAMLVGIERYDSPEPSHLSETDIQYLKREDDGSITGAVLHPGTYSLTMDGEPMEVKIGGSSLSSIDMPVWDLVAVSQNARGEEVKQTFHSITLNDLSAVPALKGFTGIAAYGTIFNLDGTYLAKDVRPYLNLGQLYDGAEVKINGRLVTTLASFPFQVDIKDYVVTGINRIEVDVTVVRGAPAGLIGPVSIVPTYQLKLAGLTRLSAAPLPLSVVVTPPNFPASTAEDMYAAIGRAAEITNHVNFQWYWNTPPSPDNPAGGPAIECPSVALWVKEARRLKLGVTLQFQTFVTELVPGGAPKIRIANPVVPYQSATFADPTLSNAYLAEITCLAGLEPDYLVLGPEVNFVVTFNYPEFQEFKKVYQKAYDTVKTISPATQVGLSWQYDGLRSSLPLDNWGYIPDAGPMDFIGLTTYFGYSDARFLEFPTVGSIPADYYAPIRERFGPNVPIMFTEVGYSSFYPKGEENQVEFLRRVPTLLRDVHPVSVAWSLLHDVDYFVGPGASLNRSGLLNKDGSAKPVWNKAKEMKAAGMVQTVNPQIVNPAPMPFSITATPKDFPTTFTMQAGFDAIALSAQLSGHVSLQFAWRDPVTHQVWNCEDIRPYAEEATRLGLRLTIQFNTYAALGGANLGQNPKVVLLNPIQPPSEDPSDTTPDPTMASPELRQAFVKEVTCLGSMKPDYLVLGPELNFLLGSRHPEEYFAFAAAYREAYLAVKSVSPTTQVGASFQYDAILKAIYENNDPPWYIEQLGPQDYIGLTTYFSYSAANYKDYTVVSNISRDYYDNIRRFVPPDKPIVFTEVGWSSFFPRGKENQVLFVNRLATMMQSVKPANVIWAVQHDLFKYFKDDIDPLNQLGLRENNGPAKPGWDQVIKLRGAGIYVTPKIPK